MKCIIKIKYLLIVLCIFFVVENSEAQQSDSIATMQKFVQICNAYKQTPLYLNLQYTTSSNFITSPEDSSSTEADFYLTKESSYIKFGELEQMVNDSMALLISEKLQRMILYKNAGQIISQMKTMMGMQLPDSSIKNLCYKYRISTHELPNNIKSIVLENRNQLHNTSLPKETIELMYDIKTQLPIQIITTQRNFISIQKIDYDKLIDQKNFEGKLFKSEENYYAVKEKVSNFIYKKIIHQSTVKVPVSFEERIIKNDTNNYMPVKNYENYNLTEE